MRIFRLCRANQAAYSGRGAGLYGGRWNSKGTGVLYMSENRALAMLEVLAHLSAEIPDKYVLGSADIPRELETSTVSESNLPVGWKTAVATEQTVTRRIGDEWVRSGWSAVLSVPSVIVDERNFVLNPAHPDFRRITFASPKSFEFDSRLFR